VLVGFAKLKKQQDLRKGALRRHSASAAPTRSVSPCRRKSSKDASPTDAGQPSTQPDAVRQPLRHTDHSK